MKKGAVASVDIRGGRGLSGGQFQRLGGPWIRDREPRSRRGCEHDRELPASAVLALLRQMSPCRYGLSYRPTRGILAAIVLASLMGCGRQSPVEPRPDPCAVSPVPDPPTGFEAQGGPGQVELGWTNPTTPAFGGVRVLRKAGAPPLAQDDTSAVVVYEGAGTTATDTNVLAGESYEYRAWSYNSCNPRTFSAVAAASGAIPTQPGPPPAPSGLTLFAGPHEIRLSWTNPAIAVLAAIVVRRSEAGFPAHPVDGDLAFEGLQTSFVDDSLSPLKTYYYAVFSRDIYGQYSQTGIEGSAMPDWEYATFTLSELVMFDRFPTSRCFTGDCDFDGHGPLVELEVELMRNGLNFWVEVRVFKAKETTSDYTCVEKAGFEVWATSTHSLPSGEGWIFSDYPGLAATTERVAYLDTDITNDIVYGTTILYYASIAGDTSDLDVCGMTEDDTHIHSLRTRPIAVRMRR